MALYSEIKGKMILDDFSGEIFYFSRKTNRR